MVEETTTISGSPQGETKKKISKAKIIPPIVLVITVIILVIVGISYKTFPKIWLFVIGGSVGLVCLLIFIWSNIVEYLKNRGKEEAENNNPPAISYGEADAESERLMKSKKYGTYIGKLFYEAVEEHGENNKQKIFCKVFTGYNNNQLYFFGLNMHFSETNKAVITLGDYCNEQNYDEILKKHKLVIDTAKKRLATDTEKPMNTRTIRRSNPLMGTDEEIIEKTRPEKTKKKVEEDLE